MFNWFKIKEFKKNSQIKTFVCKHCKLTCKDCPYQYCYSCYDNLKNPCPRCKKTNELDVKS